MNTIKNIIFDFGDIFINLDKQATHKEMAKLGVTSFSEDMMQTYYRYEMGLISTDEFIAFYQTKFPQISPADLVNAWNAILLDFPKNRLAFLKDLAASKKYRLFLLSNTNDLHISWIQNNWGAELYQEFKNCFEQFYLSHEINFRKPNATIYEFVLNENNLIASETLFVDDLKENTDSAKKLGINVWNLTPGKEDVVSLLNSPFDALLK
ncbi:HAD-IA family hydrolase [Tenacibaculum finnmarkense]|uniref:HAD-IA family hydrolase n=1 Tax=Tenacibaculum finnmarkense TaxID=2781243 RepID=UPI000C4E6D14|nr:HAD-IA family hydrolase [Tenacibaculum finnmarkense]MBE7660382.1 HAD-IA family hydrolase [Tenacibaculum finnmarkense genomovar finnmarkense]MCD8438871.1 HAD-IA family hydrolase [Tenacibaculum finnmarkense genomovar ulcerans]MCG8252010.1 HAD-IA family hydrolase [Tenacibaculum finnmarkense genomovar finnmarkense]MCG8719855.1 HAD-IA family hydrolase [Tenacibaculum finnmarkense]MCG8815539.1 HAD-IA family hydrolase [Tenacibaculum finnmarkense]